MKHLLLSVATVALGAMSVAAESTVDIVIKDMIANTDNPQVPGTKLNPNQNYLNYNNWEYLGFKFDVEFEGDNKPGYNKKGYYSVRDESVLTITAPETAEMTRIVFTIAADGVANWPGIRVESGEIEDKIESREIVWTGTAGSVDFNVAGCIVNNGQPGILKFDKVSITSTGDLGFTSSPVVSPAGGTYPDSVTVTITAEEGADIYYTTDGTVPTKESTKYSDPFNITNSCTLKVIAIKGENAPSNVIEQTYTIKHGIDITSLRSFLEDNPNWDSTNLTDIYNFKGEYTVTYQNGRMLYIEDETAGLVVAGYLDAKYAPGDVITGFRGTFRGVNGVPQLVPESDSFVLPIRQSEYEWTKGTYADVTDKNNMSRAYLLKNVYFSNNNETETKGLFGFVDFSNDDRAGVYNGFSSASQFNPTVKLPEDGWYNIYGIVTASMNLGDLEIWFAPTHFDKAEGVETIKAADVTNREYFDLSGRRLNGEYRGVIIVRELLNDGTVRTTKVVR